MSRRAAKTPGWAAFDPKKQQKQVTYNETDDDPFPPIASTLHHCQNSSRNGDLTGKSFLSVLTYSASLPNIIASDDTRSPLMEYSHSKQMTSKYVENIVPQIYEKLKVLHPWANENLIEDIVAAVDKDIDKASTLLSDMQPPGRLQEKKEAEFVDNIEEVRLDSSMIENKGLGVENSAKEPIHDNVALRLMIDMSMVPVEPEWEDDDVYRVHRKEAIRAMRSAHRHSKAATEAYRSSDHVAAQEFSRQAQQEWSNAEKLHANAAKEILAIRNCENDDWTLDLHGLHATEAVQVLLEHLLKLESQVSGTYLLKPDETKESVSQGTGKSDRQQQLSRPRLLEVITGKGNHSRGEAALPVAVKSFLSEKGQTIKEDKALVYEDWKTCIVPFVESAPIPLNPDDFGIEQFFAAKSLISSRSFQIDDYYGFGMVPLADLFNHRTDAEDVHFTSVSSHSDSDDNNDESLESQIDNDSEGDHLSQDESNVASPSDFSVDDESSSTTEILEMIMVRDVKAGAEVFNTYGSMGNAALLHRYGFTEPDNPYDIVNIDLELVLEWSSSIFSSRHSRSRLSLWRSLYQSEFPSQQIDYFEISFDGEPELELLKLLFIISLPEKAYNEFDISKVVTLSKKNTIILHEITEVNKRLLLTEIVRSALLSIAEIRERCYGSRSVEDDAEALKTCPATDKKLYHSLVLRISERKILEKLRTYASAGAGFLNVCDGFTTRKKVSKR